MEKAQGEGKGGDGPLMQIPASVSGVGKECPLSTWQRSGKNFGNFAYEVLQFGVYSLT